MGTIFDREHEPPEDEPIDSVYAVIHAAAELAPGAADLLDRIIGPPLARRQREWMAEIASAVRQLESERGISPESLRDNPAFIDAVLTATHAAIRTVQEEKRAALRNTALNSALPGAPEIAVQQMFIAMVDRFTDWHLRLLKLFHDPVKQAQALGRQPPQLMMGALSHVVEEMYPDLSGRRSFYDQVWADLNAAGLVNTPSLHSTMTGQGLLAKRTTEFGDAFSAFIESPLSAR